MRLDSRKGWIASSCIFLVHSLSVVIHALEDRSTAVVGLTVLMI